MLILKISTIILGLINPSYGYKENLFANLSNVEQFKFATVASYKVVIFDDIFQFLSHRNISVAIKVINSVSIEPPYTSNNLYFIINIDGMKWNFKAILKRGLGNICKDGVLGYEFNMDIVLNKIFQCNCKVKGFKSRIYIMRKGEDLGFGLPKSTTYYYKSTFSIFWIISPSNAIFFDNNKNYEKFLKLCNSWSSILLMIALITIVFVWGISFMMIQAVVWYLKTRKNNRVSPMELSSQT